jgi:hypothetical protein
MNKSLLAVAALLTAVVSPVAGQARREFVAAPSHAIAVTREVLTHRGFEITRVVVVGNDRVVHYRRGNMGRGKGQGPPQTLTIRRTGNRVVFLNTPSVFLVDLNVKLKS